MQTISIDGPVQTGALHWALHAVVADKLIGLVDTGEQSIQALFTEDTTLDELQAAREVIEAHDPVFIVTNTTVIAADSEQVARLHVHAPRPDAAPVVLRVNALAVPVDMTAGSGTVEFASADPQIILVSLQDGANRSHDILSLRAV
jgi:hypothetical protein